MGFHCGNTAACKLSFCEMRNQMIMARLTPEEVTKWYNLREILFLVILHFSDSRAHQTPSFTAYVAQGRYLLLRHVHSEQSVYLQFHRWADSTDTGFIEKNFHIMVLLHLTTSFGKQLYEVFKYLGVEEIGFKPAGRNALQEWKIHLPINS